ncbi:hypothetical protein LMG7974_01548 [Campylobacter majalis]|uniref:AsmA family protein n=1 Tax=Campylobacter majalis TaxID=2790656 RepID=A0ABM8Q9N5_9BACT|nr:AsmA-like C-terminal region-containing protein [Campylobacter majalis]CAD7289476.1 hypothetical protein LMG7974_01548 [Campylobacter majalis]
MKILTYIIICIVLLIGGAFGLVFSDFGNNLIAKKIETAVLQKTGYELKFRAFNLSINKLNLAANIDDSISVNVDGNFSILKQSFNLDYDINALGLAEIKLNTPISLRGKTKGKISDFDINGAGKAFGSNINFLANIKDYAPLTLVLNAKELNIAELLAVTKQPNFATGTLDISTNLKENDKKPQGMATITLNALANNKIIQNDFNITLPSNFTIKAVSSADINAGKISAKTQLLTPVANANANETTYDLSTDELTSDFNVQVPNLAKLEPIIKQKLSGSLDANGFVNLIGSEVKDATLNLNGLGGAVNAQYKNNSLIANIAKIKLDEVLKLLLQPVVASAEINGKANIKNLNDSKNMLGEISLKTSGGKLNQNGFKELGINMPNGVNLELDANANVKNSVANFDANLLSSLLNLKNLNGEYNLDKKDAKANFNIDVSDLAKFESLVGAKLSGAMGLKGDLSLKNNTLDTLNIDGKALGGDIKASLKGQNLALTLNNSTIKDLFLLAGQKPLANGVINLNANLNSLDMKNLNGKADLNVQNGEFYADEMSKMLEASFPKNVKFNSKTDVNIAKSVASFSSFFTSSLLELKNIKGEYDINTANTKASLDADIADLNKLAFITKTPLYGKLLLNANISKNGDALSAKLSSKDLAGGVLDATLKNDVLNANINKFSFARLSELLGKEAFYQGIGDLKLTQNLATQKGEFNIDINKGKLIANNFTRLFQTLTTRDITSEVYKNGYVKGDINKNIIKFDMSMKATRSDINAKNGTLNTLSDAINIPLRLKYEKTDVSIDITGTTKEPKYNVSSDYLKDKISNQIDKFLDKKLKNDDSTKDSIKGLIKGLF